MTAAALAAAGNTAGAAVQAHVLLTRIQTAPLSVLADALELAALIWYLAAARRLARRGRRWPRTSTAAFVAGLVAVWVAVGSGLAAYDEVNVTMHVIQHLLLMMVAPPLLALGRPITLAGQAAHRRVQVGLLKVVHSRPLAALTFPVVAWFLYYGAMYGYFGERGVYDYTIAHHLAHDASHLVFFLVGYLYWQPIVGGDPTRWRLPAPARAGSIFLGMPFEAFLGISVSGYRVPIDPINTLANTHSAGDTFWVGAMLLSGVWFATVGLQWFRQLGRETRQEDRQVARLAAVSRTRAEALGVQGVREGWTVPWWRLAQLEAEQQHRTTTSRGSPGPHPPPD